MRSYILAALVPLAACGNFGGDDGRPGIAGTGSGTARSYDAADFTRVSLRGPDDVDVRVGSAFSVRAEGPEDQLARVKIEKIGDELRVGRVRSSGINWSSGKGVKIYVTMPRIVAAELAGSGDLAVDRAEGPSFDGDLAGSGDLSIGQLATPRATLSIAGSGNVTAAGTADALKIDIAGAGDVAAPRLAVRQADISIAGSGSVHAAVDGSAKITILGSGDVDLGPKARCSTTKMGSGSVRCGG